MNNFNQTFTLTFGNRAENHRSMQIIGTKLDKGLTYSELKSAETYLSGLGAKCELVNLKDQLDDGSYSNAEDAYILIVKNGVNYILDNATADDLYNEQDVLEKDKKAFMYGRVVNKKARHNLCFSDFDQSPDYENKKGTVVNFTRLPLLNEIRQKFPNILQTRKVDSLQCEGNYYYDVKKTYIGFHSDCEREIVIAVRLGADFPLYFQWFHKHQPVGKLWKYTFSHGDMYFMSDKAVGHDGKKSSIYTLRHAAGDEKLVVKFNTVS
jgi:hypothetical protein